MSSLPSGARMEYIWNVKNIQISSVEPAYESVPVLEWVVGVVVARNGNGTAARQVNCPHRRAVDPTGVRCPAATRASRRAASAAQCAAGAEDVASGQRGRMPAWRSSRRLLYWRNRRFPASEWTSMRQVLEDEMLADLLRISVSSLKRYASGERTTPTAIADRLHWLAMVVSDLAGSYNEFGIRRWFVRDRSQLDGRSPRATLSPRWQSNDAAARRVRALAASLANAGAT